MSVKKLLPLILVILILIFFAGYFLTRTQFIDREVTSTATRFAELLLENKISEAYQLTDQNSNVGKTEDEFRNISEAQMPLRFSNEKNIELSVTAVFPPQTYGNRIRRFISGKDLDQKQLSVDFKLSGPNIILLFEVRLKKVAPDLWKVFYFQSHAG